MTGDDLLKSFEAAWGAGGEPLIADFLPADRAERHAVLFELVHLDLEFRLKRGEPVRLEQYLAAHPELASSRQNVLDLLATEFELRVRQDSHVTTEEYLTRFPDYATCLPEHFRQVLTERSRDGARATMKMGPLNDLPAGWPALPGCEVLRELGRGGMGIVYLARQPALDRLVAVKVLRSVPHDDLQERGRFAREIQAAAKLRHPNIVQLHEVGEVNGQPYCLLEYMEGGSLAERLPASPIRGVDAATLIEPLARAIHYAHEQGIIHRDLKPGNILLEKVDSRQQTVDSRENFTFEMRQKQSGISTVYSLLPTVYSPKIADFGLAKRLEEDDGHTRSGVILGTASYMAPEQAAGQSSTTGPAADVYSLGAILYELLAGRPPFQGTTTLSILEQVKHLDPVAPSRLQPRTPRDLETICLKCLEKEPRRRYASAQALADDLRRFREGRHILARPTSWWEKAAKWGRRQPLAAGILAALLLTVVLGVAGISWQWWRAEVRRQEVVQRFYFNQIARAQQAWLSNRPLEAERLLNECRSATPELCDWEWHYLARLCQPTRVTLSGHDREVRGLAITPDGRRLISGGGAFLGDPPGGQVIVWDMATGQPLKQLTDVGLGVQDLALSPNGQKLAIACANGEIRIWELDNLEAPPKVFLLKPGNVVHGIAFAPDGNRIASAHMDGSIQIWNLKTGTPIPRVAFHRGNANAVSFSPDGKWFASTGRDGVVHLLDANTLREERPLRVSMNGTSLMFSPDSRSLALGTFGGQVHVWDLPSESDTAWVYAADAGYIRSLHYSPDGLSLALCTYSGPPRIVDIGSSRTLSEFRGHDRGVMRVAFTADGRRAFTGGADCVIRAWDRTARPDPLEFRAHAGYVYDIAFSPDGRYLLAPGGRNPSLRITPDQKTLIKRSVDGVEPPLICKGHKDWLTCVAYRPDGLQMASGAEDRTVILWNAKSGAIERTLENHQGIVTSVSYGQNGQMLVSGCEDGIVRIWDVEPGTLRHACAEHTGPIVAVACSNARPLAASAGADQRVCVWNLESGKCLFQLKPPTAATGAAFSLDGKLLACAFADWTIRVYEVESNGRLRERGQPMQMAVRFTPDESRAVKIQTRSQRIGLAFSKDGRRLVSTAPKCPVQMWDTASGQEALVFSHPSSYFLSAAFSPDGDRLAVSASDSVVIWNALERSGDIESSAQENERAIVAWHQEQSDSGAQAENWFAVAFHERRLLEYRSGEVRSWNRLALAHLARSEVTDYRKLISQALERLGTTDDPPTASQLAYNCVVDPLAGGNARQLLGVAARAAKAYPAAGRVHGAALYRAGDPAKALEQFDLAASTFRRRAWDWLFLAMIHHQLGDDASARQNYDLALKQMSGANPYFNWRERIEVQALRSEAEGMLKIQGKP